MADTYARIKLGHKRWKVVIQRAALIIKKLYGNSHKDQISVSSITELQKKLEEILAILQKLADMPFFKALLRFEDVNSGIDRANRHLDECQHVFQIEPSLPVQSQSKAEMSDRDALRALLRIVVGNYEEIRRRFGIHNDEEEGQAMVAMEREVKSAKITPDEDAPLEVQVMKKGLECIKTTTGRKVPKQNKWLITEYDLDFCGKIGGGGFSTVSKARFKGTMVAVKTLKDVGLGNMREALEGEIDIWSELRHDHIVPFYGASTLTSPFYIVSRYMQNGNLVQYLAAIPNTDRTKLVSEVSLGMYYLHEKCIVHGDLKGVNVLVDDAGMACITDFGLSKVYSSRTAGTKTDKIAGTLRFLAPEALMGHPLSFETDVYAFGMLIYEVFTGEIPFMGEPDDLVWEGRVDLHRPTSSKVYERGFNEALWQLLSDCISREPNARPRFKTIQEHLCSIQKAESSAQSVYPNSTLRTEGINKTDWGLDTTSTSPPSPPPKTVPLPGKGKSLSVEQPNTSFRSIIPRDSISPVLVEPPIMLMHSDPMLRSEDRHSTSWEPDTKSMTFSLSTSHNSATPLLERDKWLASVEQINLIETRTPPPIVPMCIIVTHKYFGVRFGVSSREPGAHLEEATMTRWQSIRAKKGTLLYQEENKFWYSSGTASEHNSWELNGNDVTLRTASTIGICRFSDAQIAQRWFRLQLSHARDGSVDTLGAATGDWLYTERSWRRLALGKIQQANLVQGAPKAVPTDNSWSDISLPKRCIMASHTGSKNYIICITNPGKRPGRFCCKLEGRKVTFDTYQSDKGLIRVMEETYPSEEYAGIMFHVVKTVLEKAAAKK
ncbi:kinase-like domain-containing protein [Boletus edulis]|nr:kinase-like domain-containing protein [Boletus edulis]